MDRYVHGFLATMVPAAQVPASAPYTGPIYQMAAFGDTQRLEISPDFMLNFGLMALGEQRRGLTTHLEAARWLAMHGVEGGSGKFLSRVQHPYNASESIVYFLLFDPKDPKALTPADPRPALATDFYDPRPRPTARPHGLGLAGQYVHLPQRLYHHQSPEPATPASSSSTGKGEWLTKELTNYDYQNIGQSHHLAQHPLIAKLVFYQPRS